MQPPVPEVVLGIARDNRLVAKRVVRVNEGSDHLATFELDGRFMLRFALTERGARGLDVERAVLPAVAAAVDLSVPVHTVTGTRDGTQYAGYAKISGTSGEILRPTRERWPELARQLAAFLTAAHTLPADLSHERFVPLGSEYVADLPRFAEAIELAFAAELNDEMRFYLRGEFEMPPPAERLTFCHADLKGEHLIVAPDGSRVVGVIDWNDACENDPAIDFGGLAIWLGPDFVRMTLELYEPAQSQAFFERVLVLARAGELAGIGATLVGEDAWPLDLALRQLRAAFGLP